MPPARGWRQAANPDRMPGQYWAYGFWAVVGVPLFVAVLSSAVADDVRWIAALAALPAAANHGDRGAGALFAGRLDGPTTTTAAGRLAIAWVGTVTVENHAGKSKNTIEKCRLGRIDHLILAGDDGRRLAIADPGLAALAIPESMAVIGHGTPIYELGEAFQISGIPPPIAERCGLPSEDFAKGTWFYQETWAAPGTHVELAGCRMAGSETLAACPTGPARGHLVAHGVRALVRRMADRTLGMGALVVVVSIFFAAVGGIGALLALRRAAGGGAR
jgi:hypothetical protein